MLNIHIWRLYQPYKSIIFPFSCFFLFHSACVGPYKALLFFPLLYAYKYVYTHAGCPCGSSSFKCLHWGSEELKQKADKNESEEKKQIYKQIKSGKKRVSFLSDICCAEIYLLVHFCCENILAPILVHTSCQRSTCVSRSHRRGGKFELITMNYEHACCVNF